MNTTSEYYIKKSLKRYASMWAYGLVLAMIIGGAVKVYLTDGLMMDMGYAILFIEFLSGAVVGAMSYLTASAGLTGLFWVFGKTGNEEGSFSFARGSMGGLMIFSCWAGISIFMQETPKTIGGMYAQIINDFNSIPLMLLIAVSITGLSGLIRLVLRRINY